MGRTLLSLLAVFSVIAACGGSDNATTPKSGNGVNDVHQACVLRASFVRANNNCSVCEAGVVNAHCECEALKDFSGACLDQENARKAACAQSVDDCISPCDRADCACIEKCYAGQDACKKASDARDGCIAAACADHCK